MRTTGFGGRNLSPHSGTKFEPSGNSYRADSAAANGGGPESAEGSPNSAPGTARLGQL